jgi:hypothetical protein
LDTLEGTFYWLVLEDCLLDLFRDVFDLSLDGIVVCDSSLDRDSLGVNNFLVLNNLFFIGDSLNFLYSIIFNIFFLERDVLDSTFNRNFISNGSCCISGCGWCIGGGTSDISGGSGGIDNGRTGSIGGGGIEGGSWSRDVGGSGGGGGDGDVGGVDSCTTT